MASRTILIVRHGEKPEPGGANGVDVRGVFDDKSLTATGWQRAGAWAELFAPSLGNASMLPKPTAIYASAGATHKEIAAGTGGSKSRRPLETVAPLAAKLGIDVNEGFSKGREADLAAAISALDGVTLVCWQHEDIVAIANAIAPNARGIPAAWPGDWFNAMFRLDRSDAAPAWEFRQVVPVMLPGDRADPIQS
jgi:hypothetical protein